MHVPVLLSEVMAGLRPTAGGRYIDCTVGAGGHSFRILELSAPHGRLLALDADPAAVEIARQRLREFATRVVLISGNFSNLRELADEHGFRPVEGILFDLGLSSLQLEQPERGFSFQQDGPLDMRFDPGQELTADYLVNSLSPKDLAALIRRYGQERRAGRIARAIAAARPIETTKQLAEVVARAVGRRGRIHPATRTFQALRIAVNEELDALARALPQAVELLGPGGRLAVIAFHSLEDRLVKDFLRQESRDCICPPEVPLCVCGHRRSLEIITRRPIMPSAAEVRANPRSRSARLRIAARLAPAD